MRDKIHQAVRVALEKDGWQISRDLVPLRVSSTRVEIDLEASKMLDMMKEIECMLVEVKTLGRKSIQYEFYGAYGQYSFYKYMMKRNKSDKELYLAISSKAYESIKAVEVLNEWIEEEEINFIIVNIKTQEIEKWISY